MVKVVFITGAMRSGSTVLTSVLGAQPGWFAAGEASYGWAGGNWNMCACGQPTVRCEVWKPVLNQVAAQLPPAVPDLEWMVRYQDANIRMRHMPGLLRAVRRHTVRDNPDAKAYLEVRAMLYDALAAETGASVIVDSSKQPVMGLLVACLDNVEVTYVHLVRDPQATVASEAHHRSWEGIPESEYPPPRAVTASALFWLSNAVQCEQLLRCAGRARSMRIRYEDWAANPEPVTASIMEKVLGGPVRPSGFVESHTIALPESHVVAGNPSRFSTGTMKISGKANDELSVSERRIVRAITAPMRWRYGY